MPPVIRWIMSSAMSMFASPSNNSSPSSNPNTPSRRRTTPTICANTRAVIFYILLVLLLVVLLSVPYVLLARSHTMGLEGLYGVSRLLAPITDSTKYRLHEVVSVQAQEAVLHAGPNLRQRIEHDPPDIRAGPVEDRDELLRCGLPGRGPIDSRCTHAFPPF